MRAEPAVLEDGRVRFSVAVLALEAYWLGRCSSLSILLTARHLILMSMLDLLLRQPGLLLFENFRRTLQYVIR